MQKRVTIRRCASPDNLKQDVRELLNELDRELFTDRTPCPKDDSYWWFAFYKGDVIGFAGMHYYPNLNSAFLARVGVLSGYRGLGLQKKFIKLRERQAAKDGYSRIVTYTSYDNIHSANNLISCGYKLYVPRFEYGVKNALYFIKTLDKGI